jgi:hypothetical protein
MKGRVPAMEGLGKREIGLRKFRLLTSVSSPLAWVAFVPNGHALKKPTDFDPADSSTGGAHFTRAPQGVSRPVPLRAGCDRPAVGYRCTRSAKAAQLITQVADPVTSPRKQKCAIGKLPARDEISRAFKCRHDLGASLQALLHHGVAKTGERPPAAFFHEFRKQPQPAVT